MRIIGYILLFLFSFLAFIPKENLFFLLQKEISSKKVFINPDNIKEIPFNFHLSDIDIFYKSIKVSKIDEVDILTLLVFNKITLKNLKINFQNLLIKKLTANNNLFNPSLIFIDGISNFGKIEGYINLKDRLLKIYIINLSNNNIKYLLKKDKKGYFYAIKF